MSGKVVIGAELQLQSSKALESVGQIKQAFKEATKSLHAAQSEFGEFSSQAVEAAKQVANLKDRLGDAANLVDAFNPDQKFKAFSNSIQGVLGGFTAVQGVMGLLGSQSADVEKALLKVQSAMALMQGVDAVLDSVQSFKSLSVVIKSSTIFQKAHNAVTVIASAIMRAFGASVVSTSVGFKALKVAIASTGIGLLVVGLGLLISKISDWISGTDDAEAAQKRLEKAINAVNAALEKNLAQIDFDTKRKVLLAKIAGKSQEDLFKITKQGLGREYAELKNAYEDKVRLYNQEVALDEMKEEDLAKMHEDVLNAKEAYIKKGHDYELAGLQNDSEVADKKREDQKKELEDLKQLNKTKLEEQKKLAEEQKKQKEADRKAAQDLNKDLNKSNTIDGGRSETEKKLLALQFEYQEKKAIIEKGEGDLTELYRWFANQRKQIIDDAQIATNEANAKRNEERIAREQEQLQREQDQLNQRVQAHREAAGSLVQSEDYTYKEKLSIIQAAEESIKQMTNLSQEERTEYERNFSDARVYIAQLEYEHKQNMMSLEANALGAFAELAGTQTAAGKALALAATTISTYQAAQDAYRNQLAIPEPSAQFRAVLAAAAAVAAGLAKVKAISNVKVPKSAGISIPSIGGNGGAPLSPQLGNQLTSLDRNTINSLGNQAIRTFVTETDVTTNQETIRRINRRARIG